MPLILAGVEVPRRPQVLATGGACSPGEWRLAGELLAERALKAALARTDKDNVKLITGEPDEGVFALVEKYGVHECPLVDWMTKASDRAAGANPDDLVIFIRAEVVMRSYGVLDAAIAAARKPNVTRVETAYTLKRPFGCMTAGERALCPAFEVHRLTSFGFQMPGYGVSGSSVEIDIDEDDFAVIDTPAEIARAERIITGR